MCGIAGFVSDTNFLNESDLRTITDVLYKRGPDAGGYFFNENIGLGHRRLSIIDLSDTANQPMHSACGNYTIVFNGEVYNFREIANEILKEQSGFQFKTHSDTEVILEAFVLWKEKAIEKLNGMFAFAIINKTNKKFWLVRDRVGIKPIYYYYSNGNFIFSSELKSIAALKKKLSFSLDKEAINQFLHLGYIPFPNTIYNEVKKFPAGCYLSLENNQPVFHTYWKLEDKIQSKVIYREDEALNKLKELVASSVKYRLISDVPFGTFLSGGIDSSLVTAVAQSISTEPVKTFSIAFDSKKNEAPFAAAVANHLGTNHHEFKVTETEAIEIVPKLCGIYDEPYADSSAIPTLMVSKLARSKVTMTLSGDGGDELFMGYGAYKWATRLGDPSVFLTKGIISLLLKFGNNRQQRVANLLQRVPYRYLKSHIFSQEQYLFSRKEISKLLNKDWYNAFEVDEVLYPLNRKLSSAELQALFDLKYYLPDDLLVKVDRATMYHSLETRVPLLDYRIVEFALNLSQSLKFKNGEQKYLLKKLLYSYVPEELFQRPKWGFSVPLSKWLSGPLNYLIEEFCSKEIINKYGIVNYAEVEKLIKNFRQGKEYLYNRIWLLIVLHQWLKENE